MSLCRSVRWLAWIAERLVRQLQAELQSKDAVPGASRQQPNARTTWFVALIHSVQVSQRRDEITIQNNLDMVAKVRSRALQPIKAQRVQKCGARTKRSELAFHTTQVSRSIRVTRNMRLNSARQAVFQTAELLEEIFLYFSVQDMWRIQGVCRQFRDITITSSKIKSAMLLTPDPAIPRPCWKAQMNAHTGEWRSVVSSHAERSPGTIVWNEKQRTPARLAPVLKLRNHQISVLNPEEYRTNSAQRLQYFGDEQAKLKVQPDFSTVAPWEDCFITNPPCFTIGVTMKLVIQHHGKEYAQFRVNRTLKNEGGIKVGEMIRKPLITVGAMEWWDDGRYFKKSEVVPSQVIAKVEKKFRCKAEMNIERSWCVFSGMAIPCEEEWRTVPYASVA